EERLESVIEETVRPAEVRALDGSIQRLRRAFGVVLHREVLRPEHVELIAIVHRDIERVVVPRDGRHLTQGCRELRTVLMRLSEFVVIDLPNARMSLEKRTWVLALDARPPIGILTGIGRCADVDVEGSLAVKGQTLVPVALFGWKSRDHGFGLRHR